MKRQRVESRSCAINSQLTETKVTLRSRMKELDTYTGMRREMFKYKQLHETGKTEIQNSRKESGVEKKNCVKARSKRKLEICGFHVTQIYSRYPFIYGWADFPSASPQTAFRSKHADMKWRFRNWSSEETEKVCRLSNTVSNKMIKSTWNKWFPSVSLRHHAAISTQAR